MSINTHDEKGKFTIQALVTAELFQEKNRGKLCLKLRETLDTTVVLWCASVKAFIEIFEENKKKPFRIIVITKRGIFIVNH